MEIEVILNGETKSIPSGLKVPGLLNLLSLSDVRVAIELNKQILKRSSWPTTEINPGDRIEIVHFVGGGAFTCELN
jgi:sulfur carrier protein